ncbi:predicted protein [Histoplasma mississippiense (nom. inval.)]|uniref:predicted protein n=1 Tax=Ajellomyces capsulatus (strain NAm1 / WU24) TaxID=2059318 RepID=UPI000157B6E4|nr:predicted protein [Histoplasma mississippiense (nom. inval.)]EDN02699.1 predicted protein [Histoplasma mississippiense (nom. inval.)]
MNGKTCMCSSKVVLSLHPETDGGSLWCVDACKQTSGCRRGLGQLLEGAMGVEIGLAAADSASPSNKQRRECDQGRFGRT